MTKPSYLIFIAIYLLTLADGMGQNRLFVSPNGTDAESNGSYTEPYRSIDYATDRAQPGDSVLLLEGIYRNPEFDNGNIWNPDKIARITANGEANNFITIMPNPGDEVLLEFDGTYGILVTNSSYLRIVGLEIKGVNDQISYEEAVAAWGLYKDNNGIVHDLAEEMGVDVADPDLLGQVIDKATQLNTAKPSYYNGRGLVANKSHHIEFINNIVHDCPSSGIRSQQSDYVLIKGNEVYNNTFWTSQGVGAITVAEAMNHDDRDEIKISLVQNNVHHNENRLISWNPGKTFVNFVIDEGTGLFLTRNRDTYLHGKILIANNLSYYNGASGIVCHFTNHALIEQNTVINNGTTNTGLAGGIGVNNADDVLIQNNISYSRKNKWALGILANPVTNMVVRNNIIYNEAGEEAVSRNIDEGWQEADPQVLDLSGDFRLDTSSPCIDTGSPEIIMPDDYTGYRRNDGEPDIGAIEYQNITGLTDYRKEGKMTNLYPNPNKGTFTITGVSDRNNIVCLDAQGKEVKIHKNDSPEASGINVSLVDVQSGFYILYFDGTYAKFLVTQN